MIPMRSPMDMTAYTPVPAAPPEVPKRPPFTLTKVQLLAVVICALLTTAATTLLAATSAEVYKTSRSLLVLAGSNPNDNEMILRAFESMVTSKGFAAEVKRRGNFSESIDELSAVIGVERQPTSAFFEIVVTSPDKGFSERVSAQTVPALRAIVDANQRDLKLEQRIPGPIFQEIYAAPLQQTSRFPLWLAVAIGLILGTAMPLLYFFIRHLRKPTVRTETDVTEALDLPVLVRIPSLSGRDANPHDAVTGVIAAVERLSLDEPIHRLVLVGPDTSEDRARLSLALACVVARTFGQPVALVDADLQHGSLTATLAADDVAGLAECLSGRLAPEAALLRLDDGRMPPSLESFRPPEGMVRFLPAGVDRSRSVLRMRTNLQQVLDGLAGRYVVVISGPKVPGPVPTSQLLALADATLLVVGEGESDVVDVRAAGDAVKSFAAGPSGVVLVRR